MGSNELSKIGVLYDTTQAGEGYDEPIEIKKTFAGFVTTSDVKKNTNKSLSSSNIINEAKKNLATPWIIWLRKGEMPNIDSLLKHTLNPRYCYEAIISSEQEFYKSTHLEVRLFHENQKLDFNGTVYPSLTPAVANRSIEVKKQAFVIDAKPTQIRVELDKEVDASTALDYLAYAFIKKEEGAYDQAENFFKKALKKSALPQADSTAALNGLANIYYLKKNRDKCIATLKKSLAITEQQRTPYILLFRLNYNNKKWGEAYNNLYIYLQRLAEGSIINFDTIISLTETHLLLGECANYAGMNERALVHYQEFYDLKKKKKQPVPENIIENLLNFAIQLEDRQTAERYFSDLFKNMQKKLITNEELEKFNRKLALFQDKGWYDFVCQKYEEVYKTHKKNENIVRRLVAVYVKTGRVEDAQKLLSEHKRFIS